MEPAEIAVAGATAALEPVEQVILDRRGELDELRGDGHVVAARRAGQDGSMLRRQGVAPAPSVIVDDARGHHHAQPFTQVALGHARTVGQRG